MKLERVPRVYAIAELPHLHATLVGAWKVLRRVRRLYPEEWKTWRELEQYLHGAVAPLARRALPGNLAEADALARSLPSHFNLRARAAVEAAFEVELVVAEREVRYDEDWLLAHAPASVCPVPWQEELDAALKKRGLPAEGSPLVAGPLLPSDSRLSPTLADCLTFYRALADCLRLLVALVRPSLLEDVRRRLGARPLHPYLLCTVDLAVMDLEHLCASRFMPDIALGTSSFPFFARMREALLGWDATGELPKAVRQHVSAFLSAVGLSGPWSRE
ncbi:MAG TPA: hypothetical protein VF794_08060 [Archangium sp.]|jgi:hypothetical protein|uniref:hypothetical protein n=1 Tax=Archangium sp. TaxID=1872627 RepID=UPI002ED9E0A9